MDKSRTERLGSFKRKDSGIDKRNLRGHRRSIEWKQMRDQTVNLKRGNLGSAQSLSPLKEVNQNAKSKGPAKKLTAAENRRDMLAKWKEEKDLKKKLEAKENAKKKPFKMAHIEASAIPIKKGSALPVTAKAKTEAKTKVTRPLTSTISMNKTPAVLTSSKSNVNKGKVATSNQAVKTKSALPVKSARTTRAAQALVIKPEAKTTARNIKTKPGPKTTTQTSVPVKSVNNKAKGETKQAKTVSKPAADMLTPEHISSLPNRLNAQNKKMDSVTKTRGTRISSGGNSFSFAPVDFKFSAPVHLQSFAFQPLSPTSAASFMGPSNDVSVFSPPSTRRCSTPKLISNNPTRIRQSPHASAITEVLSGSSDSETEKAESLKCKSPVMTLLRSKLISNSEDPPKVSNQKELKVEKETRKSQRNTRLSSAVSSENEQPRDNATALTKQKDGSEVSAVNNGNDKEPNKECEVKDDESKVKTPARRKSRGVANLKDEKPSGISNKTQSLQEEILCGYTSTTESENTENQPPSALPHDDVFLTPSHAAPRRNRTRSLGTAMLLKNSAKKFKTPKNNRNSLILRALSPEEGIEVLKHSPMIEMTRRTPKAMNISYHEPVTVEPLPTFDDIEEELKQAEVTFTNEKAAMDTSQESCEEVKSNKENMTVGEKNESKSKDDTVVEAAAESTQSSDVAAKVINEEVSHDVTYFRNLMQKEIEKIDSLCDKWEQFNNSESQKLSEDALGHLRAAIGKGHLLIAQRFKKQFSSLIDDCEFKRGFKETTCQDLQGFWEMVYFQVEDVYNLFSDLDKRQANNWEEEKPQVKKKVVKKKPAVGATSKPSGKSSFAAFRAKMKQQSKPSVPVVIEPEEKITFEAGFFNVSSPAKTKITPRGEGGTPSKLVCKKPLWLKTPNRNPLIMALLSRSAKKAYGTCETLFDCNAVTTPTQPTPVISPESAKRKRASTVSTSSSDTGATPAKMSRLDTSGATSVEAGSIFTPEQPQERTNVRRSIRRSIRKSVSWNPEETDAACEKEEQASNISFSKFLMPSSSEQEAVFEPHSEMEVDPLASPTEDVDMAAQSKRALRSEFDRHSNSAKKSSCLTRKSIATPSSLRRLSSEKSASGRRKSRRSVHFSFCKSPTPAESSILKAPVTPFNKDSLVPRTRRSSHNKSEIDSVLFTPTSCSTATAKMNSPIVKNKDPTSVDAACSDTPSSRLARLKMDNTPSDSPKEGSRRSNRTRRISGFTPPESMNAQVPRLNSVMEDELVDLMSFSPSTTNNAAAAHLTGNNTPRRSRRSTRQSLL